jgi:hypothetical protein
MTKKEKDYIQELAKILYLVIMTVFWVAVIFFIIAILFAIIGGTLIIGPKPDYRFFIVVGVIIVFFVLNKITKNKK